MQSSVVPPLVELEVPELQTAAPRVPLSLEEEREDPELESDPTLEEHHRVLPFEVVSWVVVDHHLGLSKT